MIYIYIQMLESQPIQIQITYKQTCLYIYVYIQKIVILTTPDICFNKYQTKIGDENVANDSVDVKLCDDDNHIANAMIISPA